MQYINVLASEPAKQLVM